MSKYQRFAQLMFEQHRVDFGRFQPIHDAFQNGDTTIGDKFHELGREILDIVRDWERRLCYGTEKGKYAKYSAGLAEKFRAEIKKKLPLLDEIGVKRSKPNL